MVVSVTRMREMRVPSQDKGHVNNTPSIEIQSSRKFGIQGSDSK
jgi:hypothetical protein